MNLRPTPTWRSPVWQGTTLAVVLTLGCGDGRAPADRAPASAAPKAPATVAPASSASTAPATATPPSAAPASQPPTALFTGEAPAIPPAFEGLTPGMPMLAAKVLFPDLANTQQIPAPFANLKLQVLGDAERVYTLMVLSRAGKAPSGAELRAMMTRQWGKGVPGRDSLGRVTHFWHADGVRVRHRQEPEGHATILFDGWQTVDAFNKGALAQLERYLGRPIAEAKARFEQQRMLGDHLEVILPAMQYGQPTTALFKPDAKGVVEEVMVHLSFIHHPTEKEAILKGLIAARGPAKRVKQEGQPRYQLGRMHIDLLVDKWRLTIR